MAVEVKSILCLKPVRVVYLSILLLHYHRKGALNSEDSMETGVGLNDFHMSFQLRIFYIV